LLYEVLTLSNKSQLCYTLTTTTFEPIVLHADSSEEEIVKKLKAAPLFLTVKIAAAIGRVWQESA
jgi:hypothetical protein